MLDLIAPLAGVLVGGVLTIAGQVLGNLVSGRAERRRERAMVRAAARLQQHSYWFFQEAAARMLRNGAWPPAELDDRYVPSRDDMRLLSGILEPEDWRLYSTAIRMQLEINRDLKEAAGRSLMPADLVRIFAAYVCAGSARRMISRTSGVYARPHSPGEISLTHDEIREALDHPLLEDELNTWLRRTRPGTA